MSASVRASTQRRGRTLVRATAAYAAVAWVVVQLVGIVSAPLGLPEWSLRAAIVGSIAGLPLVLGSAWALSRQHARRADAATDDVEAGAQRPRSYAVRYWISATVIAVLVAALAALLVRTLHLGSPPPPANPAVAVLPFRDTGNEAGRSDFADGLVEEIVDRLGRAPGLRVVATNSSFKMRDAEPRDVAERLGVTTVLVGTVQRTADRLRLKARLVDGHSGYVVWSGSFDREPRDIFTVQAELAAAIVNAIVPTARGETVPAPAPPSATELSAYDLYLIGRQGEWQRSPDAIHRALAALERSVELNPNFAPAQAQLALTLITGASYANLDFQESYQRAEAAARRALALDDKLAAGHVALAIALTVTEQKTAADVLPMLERAIELNPNDSVAMFRYSGFLGQLGRFDESNRWAQKSLEVDPLAVAPRSNLICDLHARGARRRAEVEEAKFERLFANDAEGMTGLARTRLRCLGDPAGAARAAMAATRLVPATPTPAAMLYLHHALVAVGASDEARRLREGSDWQTTSPDVWTYAQALEAGTTADPAARDSAIEAMRRLPPSPVRDAALVYWLAERGRAAEATTLLDSADRAGPLRLYGATALERDVTDAASLCVRLQAQPRSSGLARDIAALRADLSLSSKANPPIATSWVAAAMLASCEGNDALAVDSLRHAFAVDALPAGFAPMQPWFSRLRGQPEYDRMVAQWSAEQARNRAAVLATIHP